MLHLAFTERALLADEMGLGKTAADRRAARAAGRVGAGSKSLALP
jgi:hypothetical protein